MLAVFMSAIDGEMRIMSQRITTSGTAIDQEPTLVYAAPVLATPPKVAWNGEVYLIVWSLDADDTVGKRVSATNTVIDANLLLIAVTPPPGETYTAGAVGAAGSTFVVGIFHRSSFHEPVRYVEFVRVDGATGNVMDQTPIFIAGGFAREMTGNSFNGRAILAWAQYGNHDSHTAYTQAMIVDANGGGTGPSRVSAQQGHEPDIAIAEDRALIVWHDDNTIHQDDVEGRFMFPDGSMPSAEFPISNAAEEQMFPAVGWDGSQFVVAWSDYRHIDGVQQARSNIMAARVLENGSVLDPNGIPVTDSPLPEDLPAVGGGGGSAVIMFSMLNGVAGVPEIQRLAYCVLGEPSHAAALTDFTVTFGTLISGGLQDLVDSDDAWLRTRSIPGFTAEEANLMELRVGAETVVQNADTLDLTLEGRLNQPGGTVRVRFRDWSTNAFVQVHQYPIGFTETVETIEGIDATNRVRASDGRIELSLRHSVFATFSALGFDSFTDQVVIGVE